MPGFIPFELFLSDEKAEEIKRTKPEFYRFFFQGKYLIPDKTDLSRFLLHNDRAFSDYPNSYFECFTLKGDLKYGYIIVHEDEEDPNSDLIIMKLGKDGDLEMVPIMDFVPKRKNKHKNKKRTDDKSENEPESTVQDNKKLKGDEVVNFDIEIENQSLDDSKLENSESIDVMDTSSAPDGATDPSQNPDTQKEKENIPTTNETENNIPNTDSNKNNSKVDKEDEYNIPYYNPKSKEKQFATPESKPKISPIVFRTVENPHAFFKEIAKCCAPDFSIKLVGLWIKLFPESKETKEKIFNFLKLKEVDFYLTPEGTPPLRVVIKGLSKFTQKEEIVEELKDLGFEGTVSQMKSRIDNRLLSLFKINITRNGSEREIYKLRTFLYVRVEVEEYRPSRKATQCFNCQGFYHLARYCHFKPKCVACGENHDSRECPRKSITDPVKPPPSCCNCGEQHPASYKGCKRFPVKAQFKKSFAEATKSSITQPKTAQKNPEIDSDRRNLQRPRGIAQKNPIHPYIPPQQIYTENELSQGYSNLIEIIQKIKDELNIKSFSDLADKFTKIYEEIVKEEDPGRKTLKFMDSISKKDSTEKISEIPAPIETLRRSHDSQ